MREGVQIPPRPLPTRKALIIRFVLGLIVLGVLISVGAAGLGIALIVVWVLRGARLMVRLRRGEERPQRRYRVVPALGHAIGRARPLARHHRAPGARRTRSASPAARS